MVMKPMVQLQMNCFNKPKQPDFEERFWGRQGKCDRTNDCSISPVLGRQHAFVCVLFLGEILNSPSRHQDFSPSSPHNPLLLEIIRRFWSNH